MPPVREASTKPSAATVLPAPVACSNQKRLAALGSSAASAVGSPSSRSGSLQSSGSSSGSSSTSSSGRSSSPGIAAEASISGSSLTPAPLPRPLPLGPRCDSASSAVSVPESASTWWADSTVPSTSVGSSCDSRRSRPSSSDQRRRHLADGAVWPSASSFRTHSSATRRGIPGARDTDASSPSSRKGSRANASARSRSSEEGRGATARVAVSGSAMKARQIDVGGSRRYPPHGFELPDRNWGGVIRTPAREAPHIQADPSDGDAASATVCPDATSRGHSRRARARRRARRRAQPGGRWGQRRRLPAALRPRQGAARSGRRAGAAGRAARPVRGAARRRPRGLPQAPREARGLPRGGQQVGVLVRAVPHGVPDLPVGVRRQGQAGRLPRAQRRRLERSRPQASCARRRCPSPPTSTPRRTSPSRSRPRPTTRSRSSSTRAASSSTPTRAATAGRPTSPPT